MRKFIKKILNLIGWLLLALMILSVIATIVINIPIVQNRITAKAMIQVEELFGSQITFSDVDLRLFNRAEFEELLILDLQGDTLIYAPVMKVTLPGIMRKLLIDPQTPVRLGSLYFDRSYIRFYTDSTRIINLKFIPDTIKAKRKLDKIPEPFFIDKIHITNSSLYINRFDGGQRERGVDLKQLKFNNFNLKVENLRAFTDTVDMNINHLSFVEKSGFNIIELKSNLHITDQQLYFDDIEIETPSSDLNLNNVYFDFNDFEDFAQGGLLEKVNLNVLCNKSELNLTDLGFFSHMFSEMDNDIEMSGKFYGTIANLNARNFKIDFGQDSYLHGRFDITGLPDANSTFLIFDAQDFKTTAFDLITFKLPQNKRINLPDVFNDVSYFSYKGNFTGFFNDFVSYGALRTNLGDGTMDILFKPDSNNTVNFSGKLVTQKFNIGEMAGMPDFIGSAELNLSIDGRGAVDKGFDVDIMGDINNFEVNDYTYQSINVDGLFSQKKFHGSLTIKDPNLNLNFDGLFDVSSEVWKYNFTANVYKANLYTLNIHKKDPNYTASFLLHADLTGNTIDEVNGEVKLLNSLFSKTDAQIQVYDLALNIRNDSIANELYIKSDFFDGNILGRYKLTRLAQDYMVLVDNYLPSLNLSNQKIDLPIVSDFSYEIKFKNSKPLFNFFLPDYSVAPRTLLQGELRRDSIQYAELHVESPEIKMKNSKLSNVILNSSGSDSEFQIDFGCSEYDLNKRMSFENFTLMSVIDSNHIVIDSRWINWDSTLSKGNLSGELAFTNLPGEQMKFKAGIDSSQVYVSDSLWIIRPFTLNYDSAQTAVNDLHIAHGNEYVKASGKLTDESTDSLFISFNDFNFANLNYFTRSSTFKFGGILNGNAKIQGISKPLFLASLFVKDLALNDESIGDTYIDSRWNKQRESVQIDADVLRGELKTLNISGDFYPTRKNELNMALNFNKFKLGFINPYLKTVFSDIQGLASGLISLTGTTQEPKLNGNLNLQKAGLTVDYLQTRYNFTSEIGITNNNFVFDQVELFDKYANSAILNGIIRTEFLKDFALNLTIQPQQFLCLNTTSYDNESFYGRAFASGLIRIHGPTSQLKFNISATTEAGTEFSIPLSDKEELTEFDFIKIFESDTVAFEEEKEVYTANLNGMQLDFNLNVTPSAEVKIIFDPTLGDEITARGSGDLRIAINPLGDFRMLGNYVIESGEYLFTMKDVLFNRKFKVIDGSSLQWTGDPVNANVDINTYYRTKATIGDLTGDTTSSYRYTVDCNLGFTGKLKEPNITYGVELPYAEQEEKDKLNAAISTDEELGKQFLSLLVLSRFLPSVNSDNNLGTSNIAGVNASELLSNQFSNWLSQISDEFDIGVNYRPGTEISPQELELALSTQLLNDRLSINGSIDMKTNAETDNAKNIPNLDLDYKITKNGKIRARAFNRANDNEITIGAPYTQGVGVFYTEEFDKFGDIGSKYREKRNSKKSKNNKQEKDDEAVLREDEGIESD